jgi:hypothetical protein
MLALASGDKIKARTRYDPVPMERTEWAGQLKVSGEHLFPQHRSQLRIAADKSARQ